MKPVHPLLRVLLLIRRFFHKMACWAPVKATIMVIPGPCSPMRSFSFSFAVVYIIGGLLIASLLLNGGLLIRNIFVSADYQTQKSGIKTLRREKAFLEKNLHRLAGRIDDIRTVIPRLLDVTEPGKGKNFDLFAVGGEGEPVSASNDGIASRLKSRVDQVDRDITISADVLRQVRSYLDENKRIFSRLPTLWPVLNGGYITSEFGVRNNPFHFDKQESHKGVDIAYYPGAAIVATADGTVLTAGYERGFGNSVTIMHAFGFMTRYAHCQSLKVSAGQPVKRGQIIATMGRTGRTTGYHLHYEIRVGRQALDPLPFMLKTPRGRQ